jgi:hypothetical protein
VRHPAAFYLGVCLTALCTLVYQITTTRIFSVLTWYHLAFLAISLAMLGMTTAGLYVYLGAPERDEPQTLRRLATHSILFTLSLPVCHLALLALVSLGGSELRLSDPPVAAAAILLTAIPFFFSGVVLAIALTRTGLPVGRIYGVDLFGAGLGCLLAVLLLEELDPSTVCLAVAALASLASLAFSVASGRGWRLSGLVALALLAFASINAVRYPDLIFVSSMKGIPLARDQIQIDRWNSHSRVIALQTIRTRPHFWGQGLSTGADRLPSVEEVGVQIDGAAFTPITRFDGETGSLDWVRHDVTSLPYWIRGSGDVAVIGVGGGRDILTGLGFGAARITGIEVNGTLLDFLNRDFADFARLNRRDDVRLVHDDGRSWLARTDQRFDLIQMSLIDSFASTSAGAMTLTENGLYTIECWNTLLDRLKPEGVFSVSRYYHPKRASETARALSLAVGTLLERGVAEPASHILLATAQYVSTLILARDPFSQEDSRRLEHAILAEGFTRVAAPQRPPDSPLLKAILAARTPAALELATRHRLFDLEPSSDDRPFFFNMLKLSAWRTPAERYEHNGVIGGNLKATQTLVVLIVLILALVPLTILGPLLWRGRRHGLAPGRFAAAAAYFSLIGLGFMLIEIGLMQKFSILLGHPIHSVAITLMSIILASGLGSLASERIRTRSSACSYLLPISAGLLIAVGALLVQSAVDLSMRASLGVRALTALAFTFPIAFQLGFFFPLGMRSLQGRSAAARSWMWGLNGALGVLGSLLAIVISMSFGIRACLLTGAACYLALLIPASALGIGRREADQASG